MLALSACGGGAGSDEPSVTTLHVAIAPAAASAADTLPDLEATPQFHAAPLLPDAPADTDAFDPMATARQAPHRQNLPAALAQLSTRGLTLEAIDALQRRHALGLGPAAAAEGASPLASSAVAVYTPAQIRAAYGLPALPAAGASLSAAQAAQFGAGQTIYLIGARHDPNIAAELAAFNQKFALPGCTTKAMASSTALPLPAASAAACEFAQVFASASGAISSVAPAYDAGWATEMALDVQWAHATAPLARIILIEAPDASSTSLVNAIQLANRMGPGVVSMSFGAPEGSWTASTQSAFQASGMSYVAATGDSGYAVNWPSVMPGVLAVGGTTLSWSGAGARSETAWSGTGGGISLYTAAPAYQSSSVPGLGSTARRIVADVSFNADPASGQYVAVVKAGSSSASWISVGGTSLAAPQWAGLLAVSNAQRAQAGKGLLGAPHAALYGSLASVPGTYAASFNDVSLGKHGSCATCSAKAGYDELTGLGTPSATGLLPALAATTVASGGSSGNTGGGSASSSGPTLSWSAMSGVVGKPFSGSVGISAPGATSLSATISGMPAGMKAALSASALSLSWPSPAAGSYSLAISVSDQAGRSSKATVAVTIKAK